MAFFVFTQIPFEGFIQKNGVLEKSETPFLILIFNLPYQKR
jgi:hypothetical protein